jgi:hypothetical protein
MRRSSWIWTVLVICGKVGGYERGFRGCLRTKGARLPGSYPGVEMLNVPDEAWSPFMNRWWLQQGIDRNNVVLLRTAQLVSLRVLGKPMQANDCPSLTAFLSCRERRRWHHAKPMRRARTPAAADILPTVGCSAIKSYDICRYRATQKTPLR